ncbi:MAG: hypothetical protein ACJ8GN_30825 [Longimicrobiaceae bacterium]
MEKTEIRAVEMVRAIRDQFYEDTRDLSREELIEFIRRKAAGVDATPRRLTGR